MEIISKELNKNTEHLKTVFGNGKDLIVKNFTVANVKCSIMYMLGIIDVEQLSDYAIRPCKTVKELPSKNTLQYLQENVIILPDIEEENLIVEIISHIVHGKAIMFVENCDNALVLGVDKAKERALTEPPTSAVLKGPRGGFVENFKTNIACIKQVLATPKLRIEYINVGKYSSTTIGVVYLDGVCDKKIVKKVVEKIKAIDIDGIIDSFYVSQFLEEHPFSMFKQVGDSEKPDSVCAKILEGRMAVVVDGSPIVLTVPYILFEDIQSSDDYYSQHARATMLRFLRIFSALLTVLLPGLYIAIQLYHYKVIPLTFLITIINSTQGIPLTPLAEILFVLILFEVLYEASVRMPQYLGIALSIVGALILGDTAVQAGIISPPAVMIVALSGITLYTIPEQAVQLSILRLVFTIAGGLLGFFGIILFIMYLVVYLNDFDNYGNAYLSPFAPRKKDDFKDALVKQDIVKMRRRPKSIKNTNHIRMGK